MSTPLLLVCAGGTAREALGLLDAINATESRWNLIGFLDDNPDLHGTRIDGVDILGDSKRIADYPDALCAITCNVPHHPRAAVVEKLGVPAERYATLLHPYSTHARVALIGHGSIVFEFCSIAIGTSIGNHVIIQRNVTIGHDAVLEDYATVAPGAVLAGTVRVGQGAYIGSGAVIREQLTIGAGAMIGMGAVVTKDVPPHTTVVGNPARPFES